MKAKQQQNQSFEKELQEMLQQLRIEKEQTEELLKAREETLKMKEEELEARGKEREKLQKELKKLQKMKETERELEKKDKKKKGCPQIIWLKDHWRKSKKEKDQQPMSAFLAFTTEAMKLLEEEQYLQLKKYDSAVLSGVTLMLFACVVWLKLVSYAHTNYDMRALAKSLDKIVPATGIPDGWMGLDIGPDSIKTFNDALDSTKTVIWNGPMGVFEFEKFAAGTEAIAKKLAELSGKGVTTIIGGGDSVAAVEKVGVADVMSHISTGGGASLELLEGKELPGALALDEATLKAPVMQIKEGLNVRPKCTMLEKAIRELEKMVAESRPPTMEGQDADISSQAVKRRLPHEVKQKLAKVARLAQANHGKISMELVNRLMSIVGHMVQLRTLEIEQGILDLLALDSISGGGHANVNLFPNVDSSWKVCLSTVERQGYKLYKEKKSRAVPYDSGGTGFDIASTRH
ncbi:hypothetical protein HYC85_006719 [Camellia sinensis]|uniref:Phosphoglycerate kinase n=1 Tax=Camellia sinensis TaxID=4442 RepID=A0A7J7HLX4_CAMSI|nr:hypothetical protein HYC85_006719 [Camellia sinensis]